MLSQTKNIKNNSQDSIYKKLNIFAHSYPNLARCNALPISLFNAGMDLLSIPISIIENLSLAIINLVGACFHLRKCSYQDAGICLKRWGKEMNAAVFLIMILPIEICLKTMIILAQPTDAKRNLAGFVQAVQRPRRDT
ncbi:MAG: hypothetical protein ACSNEK_07120 [Parachlamydiaceae bacterium]